MRRDYKNIGILSVWDNEKVTDRLVEFFTYEEGENSWKSDLSENFMRALLQPLVLLRDIDMVIGVNDLNSVKCLDDLLKCKKVEFSSDITVLVDYLDCESAYKLYAMMCRLADDKDFAASFRGGREFVLDNVVLLKRMLHQFEVDLEVGVDYSVNEYLKGYCRISTKVWKDMINRVD